MLMLLNPFPLSPFPSCVSPKCLASFRLDHRGSLPRWRHCLWFCRRPAAMGFEAKAKPDVIPPGRCYVVAGAYEFWTGGANRPSFLTPCNLSLFLPLILFGKSKNASFGEWSWKYFFFLLPITNKWLLLNTFHLTIHSRQKYFIWYCQDPSKSSR